MNVPRKFLLRNKLSTICMIDIDTMVSYLVRITVLKDHLAAIGTKEKDERLVSIMLNWFDSSLIFFVQGVHAHEDLPTNKLWSKLKSQPFAPKAGVERVVMSNATLRDIPNLIVNRGSLLELETAINCRLDHN